MEVVHRYDKVIFDLDNTIYPEKVFDYSAFRHIALKFNFAKNNKDAISFAKKAVAFKALDRKYLFDRLFPDLNSDQILELVDFYQNFRFGSALQKYSIRETLSEIFKLGKDMYLVTNGHPVRQKNKILDLEISNFFRSIYICHPESKYNLKPSVDVLDRIGIPMNSRESVMIGDDVEVDGGFAKTKGIDYCQLSLPAADIEHNVFKYW